MRKESNAFTVSQKGSAGIARLQLSAEDGAIAVAYRKVVLINGKACYMLRAWQRYPTGCLLQTLPARDNSLFVDMVLAPFDPQEFQAGVLSLEGSRPVLRSLPAAQ